MLSLTAVLLTALTTGLAVALVAGATIGKGRQTVTPGRAFLTAFVLVLGIGLLIMGQGR